MILKLQGGAILNRKMKISDIIHTCLNNMLVTVEVRVCDRGWVIAVGIQAGVVIDSDEIKRSF